MPRQPIRRPRPGLKGAVLLAFRPDKACQLQLAAHLAATGESRSAFLGRAVEALLAAETGAPRC